MNFFEENTLKKILYTFLGVLIISLVIAWGVYIFYGSNTEYESGLYGIQTDEYDIEELTKEVSSSNDKNIAMANNLENSNISKNESVKNSSIEKSNNTELKKEENITKDKKMEKENVESKNTNSTPIAKKELDFDPPVDGEILKDFANETLIYSKTLGEWTTHLGIDIKGAKTTIVKAAESGTVESIKNDPRYGLTITISHQDGFKTVYSNLLTTEFVSEGDSVEKGDTIATIGESASFEILDEPHLHFEMYKDEQVVNPTLYLK